MRQLSPANIGLALALLCGVAIAQTPITAVPPAQYTPRVTEESAPATMLLGADAPSYAIALQPPTASERNALKTLNARPAAKGTARPKALAVGFRRDVPTASRRVALSALPWRTLPDGSRAARILVQSPGAAALRVALTLAATDPDIEFRFSGTDANAQVFGPVPANRIASDTASDGVYWSPVIGGDVAIIEVHAGAGIDPGNAVLGLPSVSHQVVALSQLKQLDPKTTSNIGDAGACNIDVKCVPQTAALVNAANAVAQILFTQEDGKIYLCTGQLLNDATQTFTPYLFTANHCINSAMAARTMNTFWFFDAIACGSRMTPPFVQQASGAALLARSEDFDWALTRLNAPPPAGAFFLAWRAEQVTQGAGVEVLHHPSGDLKKWSAGTSPGYHAYSDGSSFIRVIYSQGTTEGGSSGAALLTLNGAGGFYEVRGGLFGGDASCELPTGTDEYSRLDTLLPLARDYLTPTSGNGYVAAVEFYNAGLRHYFISTDPAEINDLDTGVHPGWERTGFRFLASGSPSGGSPVCRFYRAPAFGDSHFYSASPVECAATAAAHPVDWVYESAAVFYITLPDPVTGACPVAMHPVWRFFNQVTTNHRYTADVTIREEMRADPFTWVPEGYGPDAVIMCSPLGS